LNNLDPVAFGQTGCRKQRLWNDFPVPFDGDALHGHAQTFKEISDCDSVRDASWLAIEE